MQGGGEARGRREVGGGAQGVGRRVAAGARTGTLSGKLPSAHPLATTAKLRCQHPSRSFRQSKLLWSPVVLAWSGTNTARLAKRFRMSL